jgi:hypothetical protein
MFVHGMKFHPILMRHHEPEIKTEIFISFVLTEKISAQKSVLARTDCVEK